MLTVMVDSLLAAGAHFFQQKSCHYSETACEEEMVIQYQRAYVTSNPGNPETIYGCDCNIMNRYLDMKIQPLEKKETKYM